MNKRTLIILTLIALTAVAAVPFVYAQDHHRGGPGGRGGMDMMLFGHLAHAKDALGLTDQQVSDLKTIAGELRTKNAPYREQMRNGMAAVAQSLLNNPNDLTSAQAIIDQQTDAERTMKLNTFAAASKALNLLSPEQRAKVSTFIAERQSRHRDDR